MPAFRAGLLVSAIVASLSVTTVPTPGHAQDEMRQKGNKACSGDARRLCRDVLAGGDMAVLACFQENKVKLSGSCRKFLADVGQLN